MNRLTSRQTIKHSDGTEHIETYCFGHRWGPAAFPHKWGGADPQEYKDYCTMVDHLAAYEDILFDADGKEMINLDRIAEICAAEWDGRLHISPKIEYKEPKEIYTDDELRYAAYARCACGAGLAYPMGLSFRDCSCWGCSDILTGRAKPGAVHSDKYPFAFYEIKSEDQPSANGATTRPEAEAAQAGEAPNE